MPIAVGLKTLGGSVIGLELGHKEWQENRAQYAYCLVATLCSLASTALAVPEVLSAVRTLRPPKDQMH